MVLDPGVVKTTHAILKEFAMYCNCYLSCVQDSHPPDWVLQKAPQLEEVHDDDEPTRRQAMKDQLMKYVFIYICICSALVHLDGCGTFLKCPFPGSPATSPWGSQAWRVFGGLRISKFRRPVYVKVLVARLIN